MLAPLPCYKIWCPNAFPYESWEKTTFLGVSTSANETSLGQFIVQNGADRITMPDGCITIGNTSRDSPKQSTIRRNRGQKKGYRGWMEGWIKMSTIRRNRSQKRCTISTFNATPAPQSATSCKYDAPAYLMVEDSELIVTPGSWSIILWCVWIAPKSFNRAWCLRRIRQGWDCFWLVCTTSTCFCLHLSCYSCLCM